MFCAQHIESLQNFSAKKGLNLICFQTQYSKYLSLDAIPYRLQRYLSNVQVIVHIGFSEALSVADPGCLSRIRIFSIPDPHQKN
jgi:hypothetical protein